MAICDNASGVEECFRGVVSVVMGGVGALALVEGVKYRLIRFVGVFGGTPMEAYQGCAPLDVGVETAWEGLAQGEVVDEFRPKWRGGCLAPGACVSGGLCLSPRRGPPRSNVRWPRQGSRGRHR